MQLLLHQEAKDQEIYFSRKLLERRKEMAYKLPTREEWRGKVEKGWSNKIITGNKVENISISIANEKE